MGTGEATQASRLPRQPGIVKVGEPIVNVGCVSGSARAFCALEVGGSFLPVVRLFNTLSESQMAGTINNNRAEWSFQSFEFGHRVLTT